MRRIKRFFFAACRCEDAVSMAGVVSYCPHCESVNRWRQFWFIFALICVWTAVAPYVIWS